MRPRPQRSAGSQRGCDRVTAGQAPAQAHTQGRTVCGWLQLTFVSIRGDTAGAGRRPGERGAGHRARDAGRRAWAQGAGCGVWTRGAGRGVWTRAQGTRCRAWAQGGLSRLWDPVFRTLTSSCHWESLHRIFFFSDFLYKDAIYFVKINLFWKINLSWRVSDMRYTYVTQM